MSLGSCLNLPYSQYLSEWLDAPLYISHYRPEQLLADLAVTTYHYEAPIVKFVNAIPFSRVAELAQKNKIKPVLTGEGSDELFLGYPSLIYSRYKRLLEFPKATIDRFYGFLPLINKYFEKSQSENINDFVAKLNSGFERQHLRNQGGLEAYSFIKTRKSGWSITRRYRWFVNISLHCCTAMTAWECNTALSLVFHSSMKISFDLL